MSFDPSSYKYIDTEDGRIAYQRSGTGMPVLMIHGITTYSFIWRKLVPLLEDKYDLIRVDLLGCGRSDMSVDYDLSLKHHADLMLRYMDQLGLDKVHLVGHDIGGGIVQILGVKHPDRFYSISMLNPVGYDYWPVQPITSMRTPVFRHLANLKKDFLLFGLSKFDQKRSLSSSVYVLSLKVALRTIDL